MLRSATSITYRYVFPAFLPNRQESHVRTRLGRPRFQFLTKDASQLILKPCRLSVEVFPKRRIDEGLIAGRAAGFFRHHKEAIYDILVESNRDPGLTLGLRFRRKDSAPLTLAEMASAGRAEMIRTFSPRHAYTTHEQAARSPHAERDKLLPRPSRIPRP